MKSWDKRCKRACVGALLTAVLLRSIDSGALAMAAERGADLLKQPGVASFLLYLQTGRRVYLPAPAVQLADPPANEETAPAAFITETEPDPTEGQRKRRVFDPADADGLEIKYGGEYRPDLGALIESPTELDFSGDAPRVLIISTHATEAYAMEPGWEYEESSEARTLDTDYNVVRVAEELAGILRQAGISVIHDTTLNDYPSYNGAYSQAASRIQSVLEQYPTIQMVIDVHRDAIADDDGNEVGTAATVNGQDTARIMLVMGTDEGGLSHPDWEGNLSWALKIQKIMEEQSPGLARPLNLRTERFNENMTPGSFLLEVGSAGDTLQQALTAIHLFGDALVEAIRGL